MGSRTGFVDGRSTRAPKTYWNIEGNDKELLTFVTNVNRKVGDWRMTEKLCVRLKVRKEQVTERV